AISPSLVEAELGSTMVLECEFTGAKQLPLDLTHALFIWRFKGHKVAEFNEREIVYRDGAHFFVSELQNGNASLLLANISVADEGEYLCFVLDMPNKQEKNISLKVKACPKLSISNDLVIKNEKTFLVGSINGFYPRDITAVFLRDEEILKGSVLQTVEVNDDRTFNAQLIHYITPTNHDANVTFSCLVNYSALREPQKESFQLTFGERPKVKIKSDAFIKNKDQTVGCEVTGYFPEAVAVNLLVNGTRLSKLARNKDGTYSSVEWFPFTPRESDEGTEITCEIQHATLKHPIAEKVLVHLTGKSTSFVKGKVQKSLSLFLFFSGSGINLMLMFQCFLAKPLISEITEHQSEDESKMKLAVNIRNFYPEAIEIKWGSNELQREDLETLMETSSNEDETYNITATCQIAIERLNGQDLEIIIDHCSMELPVSKKIGADHPGIQGQPSVSITIQQPLFFGSPAVLSCSVDHFFPKCLTISWFKEQRMGSLLPIKQDTAHRVIRDGPFRGPQNKYHLTELLIFMPSLKDDQGGKYICRVVHETLDEPIERRFDPLKILVYYFIRTLHHSSDEQLKLCFKAHNFYPKDIIFDWGEGCGTRKRALSEETITNNEDGSFSACSVCDLSETLGDIRSFEFIVKVSHESLHTPEYRSVTNRSPGIRGCPVVSEIAKFPLIQGSQTSFSCSISQYFPKNLDVFWFKKKKKLTRRRLSIMALTEKTKTYSLETQLNIIPTISEDQDAEYICEVNHIRLKTPIRRSTGMLSVMG
uniref:Ig-like domain-containing protein n=1 Tax=Latimeria chalumnae TaxID=7897 RepID=H2ZVK8_LATCH